MPSGSSDEVSRRSDGEEWDGDVNVRRVDVSAEAADVVRRLRSEGRGVPIILLTALGSLDDRVGGLDAGADDYLVKPFASAEFGTAIRPSSRPP